jgi:formate-dependent nitrite reductase membrane component NrfD
MPETFFTAPPHWGWYIVTYFFVGGIAGGAFVISSLLALFGRAEDRPVVRLGHYVACAGALMSGALLTVDLTRPDRFWHMLVQSKTGLPMLKLYSPMSVGAWGVMGFGALATLAAAASIAESRSGWWEKLALLNRGAPQVALAAAGSLAGFFLAGYTGVLLSVTNRPVWADSNLVGLLFLLSAASSGAAALLLLGKWAGTISDFTRAWLGRFDRTALILELAVLIILLATLGRAREIFAGAWGVLLLGGVIGAGIVAPLTLERRKPALLTSISPAVLVLAGSFLLRVVIVFAAQQVHVAGTEVVLP